MHGPTPKVLVILIYFILDRSFLSEIVYSKIFNRESSATRDYIIDLIENNEVKLFYLYNSHEDYIERSPKDRYVYTKEEYDELVGQLTSIDLSLVTEEDDITDLAGELACSGPMGCEVK
jgi:hypothetical protein